ncbi:hypothetical protein [Catenulispora rubra]|uniref:hypothetical protein n=1 Tax=Catenulispora rubra TaxID=280293 RepID=UPI00189226E1|nr:hypothetical protein [Catenulispora rubra]
MEQHQSPTPPNSGGEDRPTPSHPVRNARRPRIRGCGVPPNIWFAPHPENRPVASIRDADNVVDKYDWAVAETIRQFTETNQNFTITTLANPGCRVERSGGNYHHTDALDLLDEDRYRQWIFEPDALAIVVPADQDHAAQQSSTRRGRQAAEHFLAQLPAVLSGASERLATGGILAVRLPRPTPGVGFIDDTGSVITAAREQSFAYIQHIALVDSFIDDEGIAPDLPASDLDAFLNARIQGVPVHARSHSDLLIFRSIGEDHIGV